MDALKGASFKRKHLSNTAALSMKQGPHPQCNCTGKTVVLQSLEVFKKILDQALSAMV